MYRTIFVAVLCAMFLPAARAREATVLRFAAAPNAQEMAVLSGAAIVQPAHTLPIMHSFFATPRRPRIPETQTAANAPACTSARYSPAPWLSLAAERRRLRHHAAIQRVACEVGLPGNLLDALVGQESAYRHDAVSKAGAAGLTQLMPATARTLGVAKAFDPWLNLRGGARYLRQQLDRFKRVDLALAAYNAGPGRKSLAVGRIPPIAETRTYVRSVIQRWEELANPAAMNGAPNSWRQDSGAPDRGVQEGGTAVAVFSRE